MPFTCRRAISADDLDRCLAIRHDVFVLGQDVPAELEQDGLEDQCLHYIALLEDMAVATARVMQLEGKFKFQRVAVLENHRGQGFGAELMRFMMADLSSQQGADERLFFLSSQVSAIPFYEQLGFDVCSDVYMDAGIEHRDMQRSII